MKPQDTKLIDLEAYKARYDEIVTRFQDLDKLAAASVKAGKAAVDAGAQWYQREFDSPEEETYEDAYFSLNQEVLAFMRETLEIVHLLSDTFDSWNEEIEKNKLTIEQLKPSIIDFVDKKITDGDVSSVKDIIALFETGELKGIIGQNNEYDETALAAFEKKYYKQAKATQKFEDEEDIF